MGQDTPRDAPWVMRTYSGHSTARASNELYRNNLAKGQTGPRIRRVSPSILAASVVFPR